MRTYSYCAAKSCRLCTEIGCRIEYHKIAVSSRVCAASRSNERSWRSALDKPAILRYIVITEGVQIPAPRKEKLLITIIESKFTEKNFARSRRKLYIPLTEREPPLPLKRATQNGQAEPPCRPQQAIKSYMKLSTPSYPHHSRGCLELANPGICKLLISLDYLSNLLIQVLLRMLIFSFLS